MGLTCYRYYYRVLVLSKNRQTGKRRGTQSVTSVSQTYMSYWESSLNDERSHDKREFPIHMFTRPDLRSSLTSLVYNPSLQCVSKKIFRHDNDITCLLFCYLIYDLWFTYCFIPVDISVLSFIILKFYWTPWLV